MLFYCWSAWSTSRSGFPSRYSLSKWSLLELFAKNYLKVKSTLLRKWCRMFWMSILLPILFTRIWKISSRWRQFFKYRWNPLFSLVEKRNNWVNSNVIYMTWYQIGGKILFIMSNNLWKQFKYTVHVYNTGKLHSINITGIIVERRPLPKRKKSGWVLQAGC